MIEQFSFQLIPEISTTTTIGKTKELLIMWRDNFREEINCMLYLKHQIELKEKQKKLTLKRKEQFDKILTKLIDLAMKEIELITEGICNIENKNPSLKISKELYSQVDFIRGNYNKINENLNRTISSSEMLIQSTNEYLKSSLFKYRRTNQIDVTESLAKESEKSGVELMDEVNTELQNISTLATNTGFQSTITKKDSEPMSDTELLNNFKESLKLTRYRPKPGLRGALCELMKTNTQIPKTKDDKRIAELNHTLNELSDLCKEMNSKIDENCVMNNERRNFQRIKDENASLNEDLKSIQENIVTIKENYKELIKRMTLLQEEQYILQTQNSKLISYIKGRYFGGTKTSSDAHTNDVLTSLGTQNISSIELMSNINKNLVK